jgi:hypothetical protein
MLRIIAANLLYGKIVAIAAHCDHAEITRHQAILAHP